MKVISKPFKQVNREYIITSKELRTALDLKGEITNIGLHQGRSPNDKENGVSSDVDTWCISTIEKQQLESETKNV